MLLPVSQAAQYVKCDALTAKGTPGTATAEATSWHAGGSTGPLTSCPYTITNVKVLAAKGERRKCDAGLDCDVSIASTGARFKSTVLRHLCGIDWRFAALVRLVKLWASTCGMNDATAGTFNSFALTLMVWLAAPVHIRSGATVLHTLLAKLVHAGHKTASQATAMLCNSNEQPLWR